MHIAIDPGSCHMGKKEYIDEFIDKAFQDSSIKFQLFPNTLGYTSSGNVFLSEELFDYAFQKGKEKNIPITASVFEQENNDFLLQYDVPYVKFAYSRNHRIDLIEPWIQRGTKVVITSDFMTRHHVPKAENIIHLWTATIDGKTLYPNHFGINLEPILKIYDGISDHSIGTDIMYLAEMMNAKWFEHHYTLNHPDITCPDSWFATVL